MKYVIWSVMAAIVIVGGAAAGAHEGHDHAAEAREEAEGVIDPALLGFSGFKEMYNVHPAFVHFPIALIPSALVLYGLGIVRRWRTASAAGRACLYLAAASLLIAVVTGLIAQDSFPHNERIHHMMETHEHLGYLIGALTALLVAWSFVHTAQRPKGAAAFLAVLAGVTYLVLQTGDLGSRMVYVEGAAVRPSHEELKP